MFTIFIYSDVKHSIKIVEDRIIRVFPTRRQEQSSQIPKNLLLPTTQTPTLTNFYTPNQMLISPLNNNFHVITPIDTSFLVYYNFILSVNPSHANFDFNVMFNIYRMLLLPLKKLGETQFLWDNLQQRVLKNFKRENQEGETQNVDDAAVISFLLALAPEALQILMLVFFILFLTVSFQL